MSEQVYLRTLKPHEARAYWRLPRWRRWCHRKAAWMILLAFVYLALALYLAPRLR